jgi:hypothetical protein
MGASYCEQGYKNGSGKGRPEMKNNLAGKEDHNEFPVISQLIIVSNIMTCLDSINFLHTSQHGFRKSRSWGTQFALFLQDLLKSGESKKPVEAIFLDFKKAFDKVFPEKLIHKLQSCGLNLKVVNWIRDFLNDRKQKVVIDGISSDMITVTSDVPQGSVISPLLFIIYINDLRDKCKIRLFADDAVIYREINEDTDAGILSSDLNNVKLWC